MYKKFKKSLRLTGLILLIILALSGIGVPGGVRIPARYRKEDNQEQVEDRKEKGYSFTINFRQ